MRNSPIEVRPIAGSIGAEIHGVDIANDLDETTIGAIRQALLDHCVVFFRDQSIEPERHKAFARRFGTIFLHPFLRSNSPDPELVEIRREPGASRIGDEGWPAAHTMMPEPPRGRTLHADAV